MSSGPADSLSSSFTDLMTSLAVIFILLLVATTNATVHKAQKDRKITEDTRQGLHDKLTKLFPEIEIRDDLDDPLAVIIVLPEGLLNFKKDDAQIPPPGVTFLQTFVPGLADLICSDPDVVNSVVVEGHTDQDGEDLHNVELSQNRSMAVVVKALETLKSQPSQYQCFIRLLSATGRGKNDLIKDSHDTINKDKSRRVEFHLRVLSSEQRDQLKKQLQKSTAATAHVTTQNEQ
jgi:outer membrane protein OmpA-like peptidoglycan-associated protein